MLIRKIGDFYLLSSVQTHLLSKKPEVSKRYPKISTQIASKYQEIFDRGCMYMDENMSQPVNKHFYEVLKCKNIKDVVDVFFTKEEIRNKPNLRLPKLLKTLKSYKGQRGGNNGTVKYLSSDERRNVLTYEYKDENDPVNEKRSFVIKIAKDDHYSCAYKDESKIYEILCKWNGIKCIKTHNDVIRYYGSGEVQKNEQNGSIYISINQKDIILNNMKDELIGKHYLVLENTDTQEFMDFSEYLKNNNNDNCVIVFNKIMQTIKKKKDDYGFFHGDLHADNVKVKAIEQNNDDSYSFNNVNNVNNAIQEEHIKIKLFDFDFSGFLPTDGGLGKISRNILIYKLTHDNNKLFTDNTQMNDKCGNNVTINTQKQKGDINKFMFAFDYFRLLFSMILVFESKTEKINLDNYRVYIDEDDVDIYNIIINWYNIQVEQPQWKLCFRDNYFFESIFKYTFTDKLTNVPLVCRKQQHISQNNPSNNISQVLAGLKITSTDQSSDFSDISGGGKSKKSKKRKY
jgi:hypothetical protein